MPSDPAGADGLAAAGSCGREAPALFGGAASDPPSGTTRPAGDWNDADPEGASPPMPAAVVWSPTGGAPGGEAGVAFGEPSPSAGAGEPEVPGSPPVVSGPPLAGAFASPLPTPSPLAVAEAAPST